MANLESSLRAMRGRLTESSRFLLNLLAGHQEPVFVGVHIGLVSLAYFVAFLLRFEFHLASEQWDLFLWTLPLVVVVRTIVFARFHLYKGLWRYVSMPDIVGMLQAVTLSSLIFLAIILVLFGHGFPRSVFILDWLLCLALVGGVRLAIRAFRELALEHRRGEIKRALIVGAGDAGEMLVRDLGKNVAVNYKVVGFVDDDARKQRRGIHGVEVVGTTDQLPQLCRDNAVHEVLIAVPSATPEQRGRIIARCRESGVPFKTVPAINELLQGRARISQLQEVQAEYLLGREALRLDLDNLRREVQGKRVLVTGAAGSIGSELCRQLSIFEPEILVLFDRAESSLYFIDLELRRAHPSLKIVPIVGDILDRTRVQEVLDVYNPDLLYHAAAYKHVPLMEAHPLEAIQNNVFGTESVVLAARRGKVKKCIFISTDKAVSPVGVMGMTKRIAEAVLQSFNGGPTTFVTVRFGNVLGSDGSVLPVFQWQIAQGGPVTVTDAEASRYFMLLSEAAQLVLQAGAMGKGGEVFFLDMGEPVRILDLAHSLVRLSGFEPEKDVKIELTGLRPGERLKEEVITDREALHPTDHEKVWVAERSHFANDQFQLELDTLRNLMERRDQKAAIEQLKSMAARY